jgi:hypothetical protein
MLLLKGYISNFTCARYYVLYVEFNEFYVNQSLGGQTLLIVAGYTMTTFIKFILNQNFLTVQ